MGAAQVGLEGQAVSPQPGEGMGVCAFASGGVPLGWSLHPGDGSNARPKAQKIIQNPFETWSCAVLSVVGQKFE